MSSEGFRLAHVWQFWLHVVAFRIQMGPHSIMNSMASSHNAQMRQGEGEVDQVGPKTGSKKPTQDGLREAQEEPRMHQRVPKGSPKGVQEAKKMSRWRLKK